MNLVKRMFTGLCVATLAIGCGALLLFGWSGTGWKALIVPTGSMRPAIMPGSLVLVHSVPVASLKNGDVITYINPINPKTTVTHRIVKTYLSNTNRQIIVTKGDANRIADVPISASSVQGRVVWHLPHVGYWLLTLKKPIIILPIIYIAAFFIMSEEVIRLRDYLRLGQPYTLFGYENMKSRAKALPKRLALGLSITIALIMVSLAAGPTALALLKSNTVVLANNRISALAPLPPNSCSSNNVVTVTNSSSQTAGSGGAVTTGNTSGGSATSGNASNNNSTNTNITITNC